MKSPENIEHGGYVSSVSEHTIYVDIFVSSACGSCHAQGVCSAFGKNNKVIEIPTMKYPNIKIGDKVIVKISENLGVYALMLGYIVPAVLLIAGLFTGISIFQNELLSAAFSIALLVVYYLILWGLRKKTRKKFSFELELDNSESK